MHSRPVCWPILPAASMRCSCRCSRPTSAAISAATITSGDSPRVSASSAGWPYSGLHSACVDSAPTPLFPNGHNAPTAKNRLATATPSAPDASRATIDQVTTRCFRTSRLPERGDDIADARHRPYCDPVEFAGAGSCALRLIGFRHDRCRESQLRSLAQAFLAAMHRADFTGETDLAEHDELPRERLVAHRR